MPSEQIPSFGVLVFWKTFENTKRFFASIRHDILLSVVCLSIGFGLFWYFRGMPNAMEQAVSAIAFTLAPFVVLLIAVFLWNLWLAPCELAYKAVQQKPEINDPVSCVPPNWAIWKQREAYTISEFAALLNNSDPGSRNFPPSKYAYVKLLKEHADQHKLKYIDEFGYNDNAGQRFPRPIDNDTKIKKEDAIKWAVSMNFDISKIT
jgi:hypothetical protein